MSESISNCSSAAQVMKLKEDLEPSANIDYSRGDPSSQQWYQKEKWQNKSSTSPCLVPAARCSLAAKTQRG